MAKGLRMAKIKIPSVFSFVSAKEFLSAVSDLNVGSPGYSQRSLAKRLRWPVSYIPDVIKERKPFTVSRAYEFSKVFQFDTVATERLILLAVLSQNPEVNVRLRPYMQAGFSGRRSETTDPDILDFSFTLVFESIRWLRDKASEANVLKLLALQEIDAKEIALAIQTLLKKGLVSEQDGILRPNLECFDTDDMDFEQDASFHLDMVRNLTHYFEKKKIGPASYNSGFVHIGIEQLPEVINRLLAFRNWLLELSLEEAKKGTHDSRLFQMELHLLPLFDRKHLEKSRLAVFEPIVLFSNLISK